MCMLVWKFISIQYFRPPVVVAAKSTVATNLLKSEVQQPRQKREVEVATKIQRRSQHQHVNGRLSPRDDTGRATTLRWLYRSAQCNCFARVLSEHCLFFSDGFFFLGWPNPKSNNIMIIFCINNILNFIFWIDNLIILVW